MSQRHYRSDKETTTTTDTKRITHEKVPTGYVLEVTSFNCADRTTANKALELGYVDGSSVDRVLTFNNGTTNYNCELKGTCFLVEGEAPYAEVTSPTSSDVFMSSCHGRLWPVAEVKAPDAKV